MLGDCKGLVRVILDGLLTTLGVVIYQVGVARLVVHLNQRSPKVLMYHACEPAESDFTRGLSINTTPYQFASHLDFLMRYYRVVPLTELIQQTPSEPTVAITFDDGFHSVYDHAWPLLRERGIGATCYLVTDVIENNALIWLNELNWFLHCHGQVARPIISGELGLGRSRPIGVLIRNLRERYDPAIMDRLLVTLRAATGTNPLTLAQTDRLHLCWDEINKMASAGMSFGNHTGSHPPLANLPAESCREEIRRAADVLSHLPGAGGRWHTRSAAGLKRPVRWLSNWGIAFCWRLRASTVRSIQPESAGSRSVRSPRPSFFAHGGCRAGEGDTQAMAQRTPAVISVNAWMKRSIWTGL